MSRGNPPVCRHLSSADEIILSVHETSRRYMMKIWMLSSLLLVLEPVLLEPESNYRYFGDRNGGYLAKQKSVKEYIIPFLRDHFQPDYHEIERIVPVYSWLDMVIKYKRPEDEEELAKIMHEILDIWEKNNDVRDINEKFTFDHFAPVGIETLNPDGTKGLLKDPRILMKLIDEQRSMRTEFNLAKCGKNVYIGRTLSTLNHFYGLANIIDYANDEEFNTLLDMDYPKRDVVFYRYLVTGLKKYAERCRNSLGRDMISIDRERKALKAIFQVNEFYNEDGKTKRAETDREVHQFSSRLDTFSETMLKPVKKAVIMLNIPRFEQYESMKTLFAQEICPVFVRNISDSLLIYHLLRLTSPALASGFPEKIQIDVEFSRLCYTIKSSMRR